MVEAISRSLADLYAKAAAAQKRTADREREYRRRRDQLDYMGCDIKRQNNHRRKLAQLASLER